MANIIIVDGIDRIGKTTLCKMISSATNIPIFKENRKFAGEKLIDVCAGLSSQLSELSMIESLDADIIFDRFFASEYVYGTTERNYNNGNAIESVCKTLKKLEELRKNGVNVIYVSLKPVDIEKSSKEHGKSLETHAIKFDMLDGLIGLYHNSFDTFIVANYDTIANACISVLERIKL